MGMTATTKPSLRDELIAKRICIACTQKPAARLSFYCKLCISKLNSADALAYRDVRRDNKVGRVT
jgi:hypothetical protein